MNDFKNNACDNVKCIKRAVCRRYTLWELGADDVKTGKGNVQDGCSRFLEQKKR